MKDLDQITATRGQATQQATEDAWDSADLGSEKCPKAQDDKFRNNRPRSLQHQRLRTENSMNVASKITCSIREATELTGLGKTTLYSLMAEGKITSTRVGTKRLIHVDSLRRLLEAA